jgi:hypothetical protein
MKHLMLRLTLVTAFTASIALAEAGQAVPRHGESAPSSPPPSSSGGGSSSGSSSSGGSSGGYSAPDMSSPSSPPPHAQAVPRHGGGDRGGSSGGSRGGSSGGGSSSGRSSGGGAVSRHGDGGDSGRTGSGTRERAADGSAPDYARPSNGRPVAGYAVPRTRPIYPGHPGGDYNYYYPSYWYNPWGFGTFGFGYIMDPWFWGPGYGYPYGAYGYGYPGGYGYGAGGGYGSSSQDDAQGKLRITVKPREAQVKVDGYFVGTVDDFDGVFQGVRLDDGPHKVELLLNGYQSLNFDVLIVEGQTITYKGKMQKR